MNNVHLLLVLSFVVVATLLCLGFSNPAGNYFVLASTALAVSGLIYTAQSIRESTKANELSLASKFFEIAQENSSKLEPILLEFDKTKLQEHEIKLLGWYHRLFNSAEYLCFLINNDYITDKKIIDFYKPAILDWYGLFENRLKLLVGIKTEQAQLELAAMKKDSEYKEFKKFVYSYKNP